jgi:hypothetical protein
VALYRALFGVPPFDGGNLAALRESVCAGAVRPPPTNEAPAGVVEAALRALSADPDARFPSMAALLAELEKPLRIDPELDPARGRRTRRIAVGVIATSSLLMFTVVLVFGPPRLGPKQLIAHALLTLVVLATVGVVFRKALLTSTHNRRVGVIFLTPCLYFLVHRLVAIHFDAPAAETLIGDILALGGMSAIGGLTLERWMLLGAPLAVTYAAVVTAAPRYAAPGFALVIFPLLALAVVRLGEPRARVGKRRKDDTGASSSAGSGK